jgi:hypothetical protein
MFTGEMVAQEMKLVNERKTKKPPASRWGLLEALLMGKAELILRVAFPVSFHEFAGIGLFLPVEDSGGFFVILPLFEFPNDAFFFHHAFETLDGFFKQFVVINDNVRQR